MIVDAADRHVARARSGSRVCGVTRPVSSASATMNGFIVEPGSNVSVSARLRSCSPRQVLALVRRRSSGSSRAPAPRRSARRARRRCRPWPCCRRPRRAASGRRRTAPCCRSTAARSRPSTGGTLLADVLDDAAEPVLDHAARAVAAGELLVERELDAFLAVVLDVGEADHVRRGFAFRVLALVFACAW